MPSISSRGVLIILIVSLAVLAVAGYIRFGSGESSPPKPAPAPVQEPVTPEPVNEVEEPTPALPEPTPADSEDLAVIQKPTVPQPFNIVEGTAMESAPGIPAGIPMSGLSPFSSIVYSEA